MFVFSDDGFKISSVVGFKPAATLLPLLEMLVENYREVKKYRVAAENGTISLEEYAAYISLEREMGNNEEAEGLAGDYIRKKLGEGELRDNDNKVVAYYMDLEDPWWPVFANESERAKRVLESEYVPALETI